MTDDRHIDLSKLSHRQLAELVLHWKERFEVMVAATNALTSKLQETGELTEQQQWLLGEWSQFVNAAMARSDMEIGRIAGKLPSPESVN